MAIPQLDLKEVSFLVYMKIILELKTKTQIIK